MRPFASSAEVMAANATTTPTNASADEQNDSRSSSSTNSPVPADNEESDFFLGANDSQSSLGVPNFQDMQVRDSCWPPVNRLPSEVLMIIFSKLSATTDLHSSLLVSKRWARNVVELLWHRPACTNLDNLMKICRTLSADKPSFSYKDFIRRLNLAALSDKINDGSVMPLSICTRVERLTLTNCQQLTDSGLIALVENSASLLALDISNDHLVTDTSIMMIAEHCKRLQGLNVSNCGQIHEESMIALAKSCRYIKRLKLNECSQLTDEAIHAFAENCPNILEIDLHQCTGIGNGPITSLLARGNCLRELRLANCELIDDDAFLALPSNHSYDHLRILDLTACHRLTDAAVQKIISVAPRLRNLVLAKCRNITDAAVIAISQLGKNLHYVHLGHCNLITDEGVKRLVNSCNRIRYIDLGCCSNLTDDSVKRLAQLPKLKRIGLVKCNSITDDSVVALADAAFRPRVRKDANGLYAGQYCTSSLERVHLSYCVNLTLKSIMRLLNACDRLTHLSLTGVAAFQRDDFQPFCRQAPPDFTQHQRDVFCVFSGNKVSEFRDFLNGSDQFKEFRVRRHIPRLRVPQGHDQEIDYGDRMADREGFGDGEADDNDDYEGLDGSEMNVDAQAPGAWLGLNNQPQTHTLPPISHVIPIPPPPPPPHFEAGQFSSGTIQQQPQTFPPVNPLQFSSFINNQPANGTPPLSANGHASMAGFLPFQASSIPQQASSANVGHSAEAGASTAPMYQGLVNGTATNVGRPPGGATGKNTDATE